MASKEGLPFSPPATQKEPSGISDGAELVLVALSYLL